MIFIIMKAISSLNAPGLVVGKEKEKENRMQLNEINRNRN